MSEVIVRDEQQRTRDKSLHTDLLPLIDTWIRFHVNAELARSSTLNSSPRRGLYFACVCLWSCLNRDHSVNTSDERQRKGLSSALDWLMSVWVIENKQILMSREAKANESHAQLESNGDGNWEEELRVRIHIRFQRTFSWSCVHTSMGSD